MFQCDWCSGIDGGGAAGRHHRQRGDRGVAGHVLPRAHLHRGRAARRRRPHVPLPAQHHPTSSAVDDKYRAVSFYHRFKILT